MILPPTCRPERRLQTDGRRAVAEDLLGLERQHEPPQLLRQPLGEKFPLTQNLPLGRLLEGI